MLSSIELSLGETEKAAAEDEHHHSEAAKEAEGGLADFGGKFPGLKPQVCGGSVPLEGGTAAPVKLFKGKA